MKKSKKLGKDLISVLQLFWPLQKFVKREIGNLCTPQCEDSGGSEFCKDLEHLKSNSKTWAVFWSVQWTHWEIFSTNSFSKMSLKWEADLKWRLYLQCLLDVHSEKQQSSRMMMSGWRWYRVRHRKRMYIVGTVGCRTRSCGNGRLDGSCAVFKT